MGVGEWNDFKRRGAEMQSTQRNLGVREWSSEHLRVSPFWENRSIFRSAHGSAMKG